MFDKEIKIPNIGEFKDAEVIEVLVSNGQSILKGDSLITLESEKSSVEIPSVHAGKVKSINIKVGDKVSEGDTILFLEIKKQSKIEIEESIAQPKKEEKIIKKALEEDSIKENVAEKILASPKARKFARELGVNINQISGSERKGRVIESDVKTFISSKINQSQEIKNKIIEIEFDHSDFGEIETQDIPRVKKIASSYLVNSWTTIPHVTNHDEADITEMEDFRNSLTDTYTGEKKKLLL